MIKIQVKKLIDVTSYQKKIRYSNGLNLKLQKWHNAKAEIISEIFKQEEFDNKTSTFGSPLMSPKPHLSKLEPLKLSDSTIREVIIRKINEKLQFNNTENFNKPNTKIFQFEKNSNLLRPQLIQFNHENNGLQTVDFI